MLTSTLGVSGLRGSFSEEAALAYTKKAGIKPSLVYLLDMEGVLAALERGDIGLGILPVVNLQGGLVNQAFEAMGKHLFTVVDTLWLEVRQCLLALPKTTATQITSIASHPQGLAQCQHYLNKTFKDIELIACCDTAKAASDLAERRLSSTTAVIAPKDCAQMYGLELMAQNIQDMTPNLTAFIVVMALQEEVYHARN